MKRDGHDASAGTFTTQLTRWVSVRRFRSALSKAITSPFTVRAESAVARSTQCHGGTAETSDGGVPQSSLESGVAGSGAFDTHASATHASACAVRELRGSSVWYNAASELQGNAELHRELDVPLRERC